MDLEILRKELGILVENCGGTRKAVDVIKKLVGSAPSHSAIHKAINGGGTEFVIRCYINTLEMYLKGKGKMGKIIAVANQKGGVGKTTVLLNAGKGLAKCGYKTLFLDIDPQNNLAFSLAPGLVEDPDFKRGSHPAHNINMFEWATEEPFKPTPYSISENIDIIGTSKLIGNVTQNNIFNLADSLDLIKDQYDYILIDSPPSAGTLQHAALAIADELIIVTQPQKMSVKGVEDLMNTFRQVKRRLNPNLELVGIAINQVKRPSSRSQKEYISLLKDEYRELIFDSFLYETVRVSEAMAEGKSMLEYSVKDARHYGFETFTNEFLTRLREGQ
ncbi:ParA family protein [Photobacterium leiognathi]|uniref:ParA family protein n=1 Tax=Photobacterium leiognathi TaxID=553611 RepID=UPI002981CA4D|nr:ParA family protein [Photobacterium leiognathi]